MADDNFDIDIYGDEPYQDPNAQDAPVTDAPADAPVDAPNAPKTNSPPKQQDTTATATATSDNSVQQISSTGGSAHNQDVHRQAPQKQGTKRKQGEDDDRPTDPGATAALMINDLNWWISEEDIRGWANQSGCEDELNEVTFNEHKVNGKSKG
jgi:hypothetical protein